MPPGCNVRDIPGNEEYPCECCGHDAADCICPECPVCKESGNTDCYQKKHLEFNKDQLIGLAKLRIFRLNDQIADETSYIAWLEQN